MRESAERISEAWTARLVVCAAAAAAVAMTGVELHATASSFSTRPDAWLTLARPVYSKYSSQQRFRARVELVCRQAIAGY